MRLDMYLEAMPIVDGYTFEELMEYHEKADSFLDNVPQELMPYFKSTSMGQRLAEDIGQWRDANEVFDWIVYHTNYNELADDEHYYIFEKEELETLLSHGSLPETKAILEKALNDYDWNDYYIFVYAWY